MANLRPDPRNHAPTAQVGSPDAAMPVSQQDWLERARSAYYSSTTYVDSNYRKTWEDSIRAFNNQHPLDSKFSHPAYEKRSRVYRPKTRAIIRKNEAAGAAAFFSNIDVVSITPQDQSNKAEVASADIMKEILQYRLTKDIPWYQIVMGGLQDAQVTAACAHIHWEYKEAPADERAELDSYTEAAKGESAHPAQALGAALGKAQEVLALTGAALKGEAQEQATMAAPTETPDDEKPPEGGKEPDNSEYPEQNVLPAGAMRATQEGELTHEPTTLVQAKIEVGPPKVLLDRPVVDLFPVENLRIDAGANWIDPINSSPYLIHLIPMYVCDIKDKMESGDWKQYADPMISAATESKPDSTRIARQKDRDDPYGSDNQSVDDYEVVWIQRHIHRRDGQDWEFYMLGDLALLTDPAPLTDTVLHGKRPYVLGTTVIETHKLFPSTVPQLSKGLQEEINEVANQRLDNVKFVLNKKFIVKRGREADIQGLLRNVPGGVAMFDDPVNDVRELNWQDVTGSSFQEHQGLNMEMDELLGNFNPASIMTQGGNNAPARNMAMLSGASGTLVEYALRTYVETFVQPVLRQLVLMEQAYETDQVVMKIAAKRAQLFQKFGIDQVTDELLRNELTLTVNVGMGATDPVQKLNKFLSAMNNYTAMLKQPTPGINMKEVGKEIFGSLGYQDGTRFFTTEDPQVMQLQQQLQQMQGVISQLQQKVQEKNTAHQIAAQKIIVDKEKAIQITAMKEQGQNQRALATHWAAMHNGDIAHARAMQSGELSHQRNMQLKPPAGPKQ